VVGHAIERDTLHMSRALALAERGRGRTSPNPMVGAVVVDNEGVVVGRGWHEAAGLPHAEVNALADAGERSRGATLYCTLEPCTHVGRTGPCAPAIASAGIRRVVIAVQDPNPVVSGRGLAYLEEHNVEVTTGVLAEAAARLNAPFFTWIRKQRPFITLKVAMSLDGFVAAKAGERSQLTGAAAGRAIHRERAEIDAIGVGVGTVLIDDPLLTPRGAYRYRPLTRVLFDRRLRTPPGARILSTREAGPVIILSTPAAIRESPAAAESLIRSGARIEPIAANRNADSFLHAAVERLAALDCVSLLVEGGPSLHEAFWRAKLADRLQVFVSPRVLGAGGVPGGIPFGAEAALVERVARPLGDDIMIEGHVHGPH
jgi:diaminohydroxyphosphoribosylaminopyrimidine deaminase/5-amino-6-(5-phosphoribosylamino)uracil reductase